MEHWTESSAFYLQFASIVITLSINETIGYPIGLWGVVFVFLASATVSQWRWKANVVKWKKSTEKFVFANKPMEVKVLSYNIFLRPPTIKNNSDDFKNERMKEFLNVMHNYDVIALQEIFALGNFRPNRIIAHAKSLGFHFCIRSTNPLPLSRKNFLDAGLIILSRYPILERDFHIYKYGNQIDSWVKASPLRIGSSCCR